MWPFKSKPAPESKPESAEAKAPLDVRTTIRQVKSRIKALAVLQKKGKRARKTTIPAEERTALLAELGLTGKSEWGIAAGVIERRGEISAHLNFYLELRGKKPCHGARSGTEWSYENALAGLRREFPIEAPKPS
jgi:hypothetical protein